VRAGEGREGLSVNAYARETVKGGTLTNPLPAEAPPHVPTVRAGYPKLAQLTGTDAAELRELIGKLLSTY
jgi:hypothetical protein